MQGSPSISRVDAVVDFDWSTGLVTQYGKDYVSARWFGKIRSYQSETFTFYVYADQGARLWIDHVLIIDSWNKCVAR